MYIEPLRLKAYLLELWKYIFSIDIRLYIERGKKTADRRWFTTIPWYSMVDQVSADLQEVRWDVIFIQSILEKKLYLSW